MSKLTTEEFIKRSNKLHDNKYDYSLVNYIQSKEKVKIICPEHGVFEQRCDAHYISNKGCPKCVSQYKLDTQSYLIKLKALYGDKYDYSLVNYINARTKIKIICKIHGIFEVRPSAFISYKQNCIFCARDIISEKNRKTNTEFINAANIIHNNKYDYNLVDYQHSNLKVKIVCLKHGLFLQTPHSHLQGSGCPKCKVHVKSSKGELAVVEYIRTFYSGEIITNKYDIIHPLELDIYLPELNLGIEYNGIYWHKLKEKNNPGSHKLKAKLCKDKGITLINILDLNWEFKQDECKCKISKKLHS